MKWATSSNSFMPKCVLILNSCKLSFVSFPLVQFPIWQAAKKALKSNKNKCSLEKKSSLLPTGCGGDVSALSLRQKNTRGKFATGVLDSSQCSGSEFQRLLKPHRREKKNKTWKLTKWQQLRSNQRIQGKKRERRTDKKLFFCATPSFLFPSAKPTDLT